MTIEVRYIDKKGFIHFGTAPSLEAIQRWVDKKGIKRTINRNSIGSDGSVMISEQYSHCAKA